MESLSRFARKLAILFRRNRFRRDLDEEMAYHRGEAEKELVAGGMSREGARHAARRRFGNAARLRERSGEVVRFDLEGIVQDLRFAARQLRKNPAFAVMATLILALGIGSCVAIFAFVDAALIKPLPYPDPTRLVHVTEKEGSRPLVNLSYPDYVDWKRLNTTLDSLEVFTGGPYSLGTPSGAESIHGTRVSAGFFRTLGVVPTLGRDFRDGEDKPGAPGVVMLSYGAWQRRFGGRRDVIGQSVMLSNIAHTIIGVLPANFNFALSGDAEVWTTVRPNEQCQLERSCHSLFGIGRLKSGVTVSAALVEMQQIARQLEIQYPGSNRGRGASVKLLSDQIIGDIRPALLVLLGAAGLLLLIACVNVSSLLLVRAESRRREIAVRGALGASPARLHRQFITEGLALALCGCAAGLGLAFAGIDALKRLVSKQMSASIPGIDAISINTHTLLLSAALVLFASALFAFMPIYHFRSANIRDGLSSGARGSTSALWRRMGANLVVIELATAMMLLAGAGLLTRSFYKLLHVDLGFAPNHLAAITVGLPQKGFEKDEAVINFERQLLGRVNGLPGVQSAAAASMLPVACICNTEWIRIAGRPYDGVHITVMDRMVSPSYFTTFRVHLLEGNYFDEGADESKPRIAVVNRTFARRFFPGESAIGKQFGDADLTPASIWRIAGVIDNIKDGGLEDEDFPTMYVPFNQTAPSYFTLVARTTQSPQSLLPSLGAAIHAVNLDAGVQEGTTMTALIESSSSAYIHRTMASLVGGFAAMALLLGVAGIYAVIAYSVSRRTQEIGVRMALGAQRTAVYRLILKEAALLIAVGVAIGIAGSVAATLPIRKLLFGVRAWDAPTLFGVAIVLAGAAFTASFIPARRAASVSPTEALRSE